MREDFQDFAARLFKEWIGSDLEKPPAGARQPVHVVYGGADLFRADTPQKLGRLALASLETYAYDIASFADAMWLKGADTLPRFDEVIRGLERKLNAEPERVKAENYAAWFAWTVRRRVVDKLVREPIEDYRVDFEDGYGIRPDDEEDGHARDVAAEFARALDEGTLPAFSGFRIKSFQAETYRRAVRTLEIVLSELLDRSGGRLPDNFVVTLPKIQKEEEVGVLAELLSVFERRREMPEGIIGMELMIETPYAVRNARNLVEAGNGRVRAAHFGAFDYTASLGITADHQHLKHEACSFARQVMQLTLSPMGVRLSDSVTTEMPVPVFRGAELTARQQAENKRVVHLAWRKHFNNVTNSLINGFYQSWDLHPAQLVARYAALYAFFLESSDEQADRLKNFVGKATKAMMTGNLFDDAASAQGLLNFFVRAVGCGALTEEEVTEMTGLSPEDLRSASFAKIMENR